MTLMQQARSWWRGEARPARRGRPTPPRRRLGLEQLEDRTTPSILGAQVPFVSLQSFSTNGSNLTANFAVSLPGAAAQTVTSTVNVTSQRVHGCEILNLNLGPVHLDVLGLVVDLQPLTLKVTAMRGPGNLLGNLLCGPRLPTGRLLSTLVGELNTLVQVGDRLAGLTTPAGSLGALAPLNVAQLSNDLTNAGIKPASTTTTVLTLDTGPIDLNLLGLDVSVPTGVHLKITAVPSSQPGGGLLGDLLSQLSGALDNPAAVAGKLTAGDLTNILGGLVAPLLGSGPITSPLNLSGLSRRILNSHGDRGFNFGARAARAATPILSLTVNSINLDLLGLQVVTSPICLKVSAQRGRGNLLGNLLSDVAGLNLGDLLGGVGGILSTLGGAPNVLGGTTSTGSLTGTGLLQGLIGQLAGALSSTTNPTATTNVLHLVLGPLNLDLLGLIVQLNNCNNGPITVDVNAIPGPGNLLGNLLGDLGHLVTG